MLLLHAPTTPHLRDLRSAAVQATRNLRSKLLIDCVTAQEELISEELEDALASLDRLQRAIDGELSDRQRIPVIAGEIAAGYAHDGDSLARVDRTERECLGVDPSEAWRSSTPYADHSHACGCPRCVTVALAGVRDEMVYAGANTSLDTPRRAS